MGPSRALTLVLLGASLCLSGALAPATTGRPSDAGAVPAVLLGPQPHASPCGVSDASRFPGTLTEFGTLSPVPTVAGVGVVYYYSVESDYQPSGGGNRQVSCVPADSAASTNGSGAFAIAVALPSGGCDLHGCTSYAGPFGAIRFGFSSPPPAGYFVHGNVSGGRASVAVAEAFTTLTVNPPGPVLLSVAAPGEFTAEPLAADGAPSPVLFAFAWQLATAGWSLSPTASNRTVTATAMEGAGPALLGVDVNGSFGGVPFSSALHVALLAVSTNVGSAVLLPSPADVGAPVTLSVTGAGAPGYAYWASVQPTLGVASVNTSCTAVGAPEEEVAIHCTASWTYSSTGTANPTVTVSNGYSNATRSLPSERVNPALALALAPRPLATYTDLPLPFTVSVANGTGTAPFGPACVEPGRGQRICSDAPGPSWSFALPYPMVGNYSLQTSVADAANRSGSADGIVTVAERPTLPSISIAGGPPTEGSWSVFGGQLLGGVAPVQYWWNASAPGGTFASGLVPPSGVLEASFLPAGAGSLTVTLTCLDALGSRVASEIELYVTAGPAIGLASGAGPFPSTGYAGVPVPYSFVAHAPDGERVTDFARALTLAVSGPTGAPVSLDSAIVGSLRPVGGAFAVPASAWYSGYLNLSLEGVRAGAYTVSLTAGLPLEAGTGEGLALVLGADPYSLALTGAHTVVSGDRTNATEYRLADQYGNPGGAGSLWVESRFGATESKLSAPVESTANGSLAWVNFSAPVPGSGTVRVWSSTGQLVLGPIEVPAAPVGEVPIVSIALGGLAGLIALGGGVLWVRRGRTTPPPGGPASAVTEAELRRTALGRDRILEQLTVAGPTSLEKLRTGWPEPVPEREELAEWLASLVAEGAILAAEGPGGTTLYRATVTGDSALPRVELDAAELDRALAEGGEPP